MSRKLFGTDGIRGKAGDPPLDRRNAYALGVALGGWIHERKLHPSVVIGMDTRESGGWLAASVAGGLRSLNVGWILPVWSRLRVWHSWLARMTMPRV